MALQRFVLDSHAVLTFLEGGEGQELVRELLGKARDGYCRLFMSVVNLGEVLYITERKRGLFKAQETLAMIDDLPIRVVDADRSHTLAAAHIKARWPVAYADCFAAALAGHEGAALVTGDPEFRRLEAASVAPVVWLAGK